MYWIMYYTDNSQHDMVRHNTTTLSENVSQIFMADKHSSLLALVGEQWGAYC